MKRIYYYFFAASFVLLASCTSSNEDPALPQTPEEQEASNLTEVTMQFRPYEVTLMTKLTTAIAIVVTRLDIWIYENGVEVQAIHQTKDDEGFGTLSVTLDKTKTYTLYAVGHRGAEPATLTDGVISFDKVTHSMFYSETFSPSTTTALSCVMDRIVGQFQFRTTDVCPDDVTKMRFTISGVYDRWHVTNGATHQLDRVSTFENFSKNNDGTVTFNIYAITEDAETLHSVHVEALDSNDDVLQEWTFNNVPLRNGYKTAYHGAFFVDTPVEAGFYVDDWEEYAVYEF